MAPLALFNWGVSDLYNAMKSALLLNSFSPLVAKFLFMALVLRKRLSRRGSLWMPVLKRSTRRPSSLTASKNSSIAAGILIRVAQTVFNFFVIQLYLYRYAGGVDNG